VRRTLYMRGYASPVVSGTRPNTAVERGFYALPYISALPMPQLPQIRQPGRPTLRGPTRRGFRGLGQTQNFLAAGTVLTYTAQVIPTGAFTWTGSGVIANIQGDLQSTWNISVVGSNAPGISSLVASGPVQITITVQLGTAYGQAADVKSIIDGEIENNGGATLVSSSISVSGTASPGNVGVTPPPQPPPDVTDWLSQNWPLLALGAAGLLVAGPIVRDLF